MSDFPLTGVQYRTLKAQFPSTVWRQDLDYEDWQDVDNMNQVYSTGTQFRMKPKYKYEVTIDGVTRQHNDKDKAMSSVAEALSLGMKTAINRLDETPDLIEFLFNKNVQWSAVGSDRWQSATYLSTAGLPNRTQLRIRPDNFFGVKHNVLNGTEITFDSVDKLAKYVDNQIRTGSTDFTVRSIKYV